MSFAALTAEPTEAVIVSIYEGLQPRQVAALRNNRAAYSERHGYRYVVMTTSDSLQLSQKPAASSIVSLAAGTVNSIPDLTLLVELHGIR